MTRLTDERLTELYQGTLRLVAELGFDKVTMDGIAEATRSSKATLYRQWGSKTALVADALVHSVEENHVDIDTGSLRGDFQQMMRQGKPKGVDDGALIGALLQAVKHDAELDQVLREQVIVVGHQRINAVIDLAITRGEIAADAPGITYVPLLIITLFVLQPVIDGAEWDDAQKTAFIDAVLLPALGIH